ncbi:uncharacterized protein LOC115762628 [Drosophila novamexicana]|uniref:uncharacterized protein LOC115762628 n=1 Tax=Drosophila novamexicana TaxID=47314 RepID=UPI0011E5AF83|nr:uncharacterized protein LOC115762628 [Drosophila novamexicana]
MQLLLVTLVASSLALAQGMALYANYPYVYTAQGSALVTPTQQQYLTQDVLGQYAYGYAEPHSTKQEVRSLDGITRGSYSYRDAAGKLQTVDYTADAKGFHVAATNLPQRQFPAAAAHNSADAVEVAAASQSHLAAHEAARLRLAQAQQSKHQPTDLDLPVPVADTAEVAAAKSIHLKRVASEKLRNELLSARSVPVARSSHVFLPVQSVYGYSIPRYYSSATLARSAALLHYGAPLAAGTFSQYHSQDEHGQYAYGYTAPLYSKHETRTADGVTHGSYSYVDARGEQQTVNYQADANGFRVTASSLQQQQQLRPNAETAEVAALRAQHLAAHAEAKLRLAGDASLTGAVQDTPEVAAAKVAFFKRFEAEKLRNQLGKVTTTATIKSAPGHSHTIISQPLYVYQPASGYIYKYNSLLKAASSNHYLPVA